MLISRLLVAIHSLTIAPAPATDLISVSSNGAAASDNLAAAAATDRKRAWQGPLQSPAQSVREVNEQTRQSGEHSEINQ